MQKKTDT